MRRICDFGMAKAVSEGTSFFCGGIKTAFVVRGRKCEGKEENIGYDRSYI